MPKTELLFFAPKTCFFISVNGSSSSMWLGPKTLVILDSVFSQNPLPKHQPMLAAPLSKQIPNLLFSHLPLPPDSSSPTEAVPMKHDLTTPFPLFFKMNFLPTTSWLDKWGGEKVTIGWQNNEEKETGNKREVEATGKFFQEAAKGPGQPHPRHGQPQSPARSGATSPSNQRLSPLPAAPTSPPNGGQNHQDTLLARGLIQSSLMLTSKASGSSSIKWGCRK